ncbi:MAG: ABC transporter permease [Candidatus Moduliflexus flocculans]|nr:ABC transporter permease [Candidatus Moduliflexus flocculans]
MAGRKRVCFIGDVLATDLFGTEEPVGRTVFIDSVPFTVVGVMRTKLQNSNYNGQRDERCAFIPWTTYASLYGAKYVSNFIFRPRDLGRSKAVMEDVKRHLAKLIGFSPADPDALGIWDTLEFEKQFTTFFLAFTVFLGVIGSFTLLVGGVGVASIMRVVVEERTREIGVKLAVGARRRTILMAVLQRVAGHHAPRRPPRLRPLGRRPSGDQGLSGRRLHRFRRRAAARSRWSSPPPSSSCSRSASSPA